MIMEHVTIQEISDGYLKMTPDQGYQLQNKKSGRLYSEVVTRENEQDDYIAVGV